MTVYISQEYYSPHYRQGVGLMIINKDKKVLIGQRLDRKKWVNLSKNPKDHGWQMPQGGIDAHEAPHQAAMRELKEEIGTDFVRMIAMSDYWFTYDLPVEVRKRLWGGRFLGQTQKWFLFEFLGSDEDINLTTHHPEFGTWKWIDPSMLPNIIVSFKKDLYKAILEEFKKFLI